MYNLRLILVKSLLTVFSVFCFNTFCLAQNLKLKSRSKDAIGGQAFATVISDSTLTLQQREELIFKEIKSGNVPLFLRKFIPIHQISGIATITYFVLPDYFAIGSNADFFYVPMTPILAQRVANLLGCSLPTKMIVDSVYAKAIIKLVPKPIPPTKAMTTVPIFIAHNDTLTKQLEPYFDQHSKGVLTAGNKKDVILSNRIYTEKTAKVVIYGWHQLNGKPIQPVYNKHTNLWADYSHGIRFVLQKAIIHQHHIKITISNLLSSNLSYLLSDEGEIKKPYYPITSYEP
jgi:hypothetical protein